MRTPYLLSLLFAVFWHFAVLAQPVNDDVATNEDTPLGFSVTANDSDPDGIDVASVDLDIATPGRQIMVDLPNGNFVADNLGNVTFTPAANFNGVVTRDYSVNDNLLNSAGTATITVTVSSVNDAPVAVDDAATTPENTPVDIAITANDSDIDGTLQTSTIDLDPILPGNQNTRVTLQGTWTANAGVVTFTPLLNLNGGASTSYTIEDNEGAKSNSATITVTITSVNTPPVANADATSTNEDEPVTLNLVANDSDDTGVDAATVDLDPGTIGIQTSISPTGGNVTVDGSGTITFTPSPGFSGIVSFSYTVNDTDGSTSNAATVTITVNAVNAAPVANADAIATNEDTPVALNLVSNDTDSDGTINVASVDLQPAVPGIQNSLAHAGGTITVDASGIISYSPVLNFNGPVSFTYTVNDNEGLTSNAATVTITVTSVNDAPVATADNAVTNEDTPVSFNVVSNDNDVDGTINAGSVDLDPGSPGIQTTLAVAGGNFSVDGSGLVTFTPVLNFNGPVTITYTVADNEGSASSPAQISITVNAVNDAPVAVADAISTPEDTPVNLNLVSNDSDVDGSIDATSVDLDPVTAGVQTSLSLAGGSVSVNASGVITFTPVANFNGVAGFSYTVADNAGLRSNTATVTITVTAGDDPPVANADATSTNEDVPVNLNIVGNDSDSDGSVVASSVDLDPSTPGQQTTLVLASGSLSVNAGGVLSYTPTANFNGIVTLQYTVQDNAGLTSNQATVTITVNAVNDAPVANADAVATNEDTPVMLNIVSNDTDVDGTIDAASVDLNPALAGQQTSVTPTGGSVTVDASGVITVTPNANYNGSITFSYRVSDNEGLPSNTATVTITVNATNDAPVANADAVATNEDTPVSLNIVSNDTDPDGTINAASVDLEPGTAGQQSSATLASGSVTVNASGVITFTPNANFNGPVTFNYTVADNLGLVSNEATVTITVNSVNDAPVANADVVSTNEDVPVTLNLISNDTDVDGTVNGATVDLNPAVAGQQTSITPTGGTVTVDGSGVVTITPNVNFGGTITFSYRVADNEGLFSNNATVTVTVNATNDAPVANADAASTNEDTPVNINVVANDTDADGTINAASVDLDPGTAGQQASRTLASGSLSVNSSGVVTFTPNANFNGPVTFNYTVADNAGLSSNEATVTITVNPVNDAPVANADAVSTIEDTPVTLNIVTNDTDVDGTINAGTVDLNPSMGGRQTSVSVTGGTIAVDASGVITYTPTANFNGTVSFQYTVEDNNGLVSNSATVTITVSASDDVPVANADAVTTNEDVAVSLNIVGNDTDADGTIDPTTVDLDPSTAGQQLSLSLAGGSISVNPSGVVSYTPAANFNGTVVFSYTVDDNDGLTSNSATVTITVTSVNDLPVAVNDAATTSEDVAVTINLLANDTDVDGTLNAAAVDIDVTVPGVQSTRTTASGTYSVSGGILTFTPATNFNGSAVIRYTVADNTGAISNEASITITVLAINDAPVAVNDAVSTNQNNATSFNILANDTDDGSLNTASVDLDPGTAGTQNSRTMTEGTFTVNSSGTVTFSPVTNYFGVVSIGYTVADNEGVRSNEATITVTVIHINQKPVANPDATTTTEDTPVSLSVVATDTDDVSINPATVDLNISSNGIQNTRSTPQGTFTVDATGSVLFTPVTNFNGTASIQYTVTDNEGSTSDPATITITVSPINDKPVAVNDSRTVNEDNSAVINVVGNDTDADGTIVVNSVDLNPSAAGIQTGLTVAEGTFSVDASGVVTFVPVSNFFGTVIITYTVSDNDGAVSDPATITVVVNAVNDPPVANNDVASTPQGQSITLNLLTNDLDVDGTINAATIDLNPATGAVDKTRTIASGTYSVDNSGTLTFTPVPAFSGTSTITYNVADNLGAKSNNATISILVNFVNQPPVANDDAVTTTEDAPISVNVLSNDTDDGTIVTSTVDLNPTVGGIQNSIAGPEGTFVVNGTGVVTFTPALNFSGSAVVSYTVNDNIGVTSNIATLTVTVSPVNDAPVANNDAATTPEETAVTINVIANDTDVDGTLDPATVDLVPGTDAVDGTLTTAQGTFTRNAATGAVTFTPAGNVFGTATATYNVRDNLGAKSNTATITVTIANVNDPPVFDAIADQRVLRNAASKAVTITGISPGPQETEQVLLSAVSANTALIPHPTITYSGTGPTATLTFKPQLNQSGIVEITVKAVDAGLNEFTRTFQIEIVNVVITSTPPTIAVAGEPYAYNIAITPVEETLSFVATQKPAWATITSTGKNTATLGGTPPAGATSSNVTIQLRDGASIVDEQTYVLNINRRPASTDFGVQTNEDVSLVLSADNFVLAYSDPDDHPLNAVFFTELPRHGTLYLGTVPVVLNQDITVSELEGLLYTPSPDYNGLDTAYFRVRDAFSSSGADSYVHFTIIPVNDPPRITFLEADPLVYDIGREVAQIFTPSFQAEDAEDDDIVSAEIGFQRPNYDLNHDLLSFNNTSKIKGVFDDTQGILTLTGVASVEEYEEAIRSITYTFINLQDIIDDPRTVYIKISDATGTSEIAERQINLTFDFVQLNIPQVFTPDGNGMNDVWPFPDDAGLEPYNDAVIRIFDQRGKLIFETEGFASPWDGKKEGTYLPVGTYFFVIDLRYGKITYNGTVTILREEQ